MSRIRMPFGRMLPASCSGALVLVLAGLGGCVMQPDIAMKLTTADGVDIQVPINSLPEPITDGVVTLEPLHIAPWNVDKDGNASALTFAFLVQFKPGFTPSDIVVEDVTEEPILEVYHDPTPTAHMSKLNFWGGLSKPFAVPDEHVKWMLTEDSSVRVYRFTVRTTDGTGHVLREALVVSARMKTLVRAHFAKQ